MPGTATEDSYRPVEKDLCKLLQSKSVKFGDPEILAIEIMPDHFHLC